MRLVMLPCGVDARFGPIIGDVPAVHAVEMMRVVSSANNTFDSESDA